MKLYQKKPVVVEVLKFEYSTKGLIDLSEFLGNNLGDVYKARHPEALGEAEIKTLEDGRFLKVKHIATEGDYIVKGVNGEFYPVKPDIF